MISRSLLLTNDNISLEINNEEINQVWSGLFQYLQIKKLCACKNYEGVYDCLSPRIDTFDNISANNLSIIKIVKKFTKKVSCRNHKS